MLGGAAFDQAKDQIKDYLLNQKRQDATSDYASTGTRFIIDLNQLWTAKRSLCRNGESRGQSPRFGQADNG